MSAPSTARLTTVPDSPSPSPAQPSNVKSLLTVEEALKSCIRAWLVARDSVIWDMNMSGVGGSDEPRLNLVSIDSARPGIEQMNALFASATYFATKIATRRRPVEVVLDDFLSEILQSTSSAVNLSVATVPESF